VMTLGAMLAERARCFRHIIQNDSGASPPRACDRSVRFASLTVQRRLSGPVQTHHQPEGTAWRRQPVGLLVGTRRIMLHVDGDPTIWIFFDSTNT
jgi:hypothetical protein